MTWKQSVHLDPLNELFFDTGVTFEKDEVEGGYVAILNSKFIIRRPTLMLCAKAVLKEFVRNN